MENFSDKRVEKIETHFVYSVNFPLPPPPENRVVYKIMWKNIIERDKTQMTIWRMHIA